MLTAIACSSCRSHSMRRDRRFARRLSALALLLAATPVLAWGPTGHRIVAELAERRLEPAVHARVRTLLAQAHARTLADIADRADDMQDDPRERAAWRATAKLHFVNFAGGATCRYDAGRDCAGGRCVVAAIDRYSARLADRRLSDAERADALVMLVHFVADVHQPLHAGYRRDAGGNRFQVRHAGRGTNLHAIWDTPVLTGRREGWRRYADELARTPLPAARGDAAQWAEESCRLTRDLYPTGHRVDDAYLERMRPLAERRLREAAVRLARLLNGALDTPKRRRSGA
jgi:hypothetical protein